MESQNVKYFIRKRIDTFTQMRPFVYGSFAHSVFCEYQADDKTIDSCLNPLTLTGWIKRQTEFYSFINGDTSIEKAKQTPAYFVRAMREAVEIIEFLEDLKKIPEHQRYIGDRYE